MRRLSPFSTYTRKAMFSRATPEELGKSVLGHLAATEASFLVMFVRLALGER